MKEKYEYVDHPSHYGGEDNPYECIKVIEAWGLDKNFDLGTAVRYICRAGSKPDNPILQDLKKARWYLDREIQKIENDTSFKLSKEEAKAFQKHMIEAIPNLKGMYEIPADGNREFMP